MRPVCRKARVKKGGTTKRNAFVLLGVNPDGDEGVFCCKALRRKSSGEFRNGVRIMIHVENLSKVYPGETEVEALKNVDLTVDAGDVFGIIGMSGAGKSTLLRCIALLETPTSGAVLVEGREASRLSPRELIALRKTIGVIFQGYNLLMQRNVLKNITFPLEIAGVPKMEREKRALELLEVVGLTDKAGAYPAQLSGGQKQRVAIARALASNPKILLCDEPTSALDSYTTRSILNLLTQINRDWGVTVLIITHEIGVVQAICNKVAILSGGALIEQGAVEKVLKSPESPISRALLGLTEKEA